MNANQIVKVVASLTADERNAQKLAVLLGIDPHGRYGYEKCQALYTLNNGTKMEPE